VSIDADSLEAGGGAGPDPQPALVVLRVPPYGAQPGRAVEQAECPEDAAPPPHLTKPGVPRKGEREKGRVW